MKKVIAKVEYDTENAKLVKKYTEGYFGDPAGFEESLYETEGGKFYYGSNIISIRTIDIPRSEWKEKIYAKIFV